MNKGGEGFFKYWLPVIVYAAFIFSLSSVSKPPAPQLFPHCDKVYHILEYTVFGFLMLRALFYSKEGFKGIDLRFLAILLCLAYGITDEIHQHFIPQRTMELMDIISDGIGAYLGQLFFKIKG